MNPNFATTRWSLVRDAASQAAPRSEALGELYRLYWRPICDYVRRLGVPDADVEDVAQEFFMHFFDSGALDRANHGLGRFRAYLSGALRHHVQKVWRKAAAQKRGGGTHSVSLDTVHPEPPLEEELEMIRCFDVDWAHTVVSLSMERLEKESLAQGLDASTTSALVHSEDVAERKQIAEQLQISVTALKARIFRLRRRFRDLLREEVSRTVTTEADLEEEIEYLSKVLGGPLA